MISAMVFTNLLYVVGAVIAATILSIFIVFRHRRPKSLEAGIEMFSRELRALQPERRSTLNEAEGSAIAGSGGDGWGTESSGAAGVGRGFVDGEDMAGGRWDSEDPGRGPQNGPAQGGPLLGRPVQGSPVPGREAPGGGAPPRGRQSRHVNLQPGNHDVGYSARHEARAPSPDMGDQPG